MKDCHVKNDANDGPRQESLSEAVKACREQIRLLRYLVPAISLSSWPYIFTLPDSPTTISSSQS
jgi:hypothetical protein